MWGRHGLVIIGLCAGLLVAASGCAVPQPKGAGLLKRHVEPTTRRGYWLYLPVDYVQADAQARKARRWPLVVTFHGMKPFDGAYAQAREWEYEADRYGFIVVAPELKAPSIFAQFPVRTVHPWFRSDVKATLAILDDVFRRTEADPQNVLATSWSSGGYMAHYMLNHYPERFTCLAVRQSNFSRSVLDPKMCERSKYHPILIVNTENDFAICRTESRDAIRWYENHGYKNVWWVVMKRYGHVRTPDVAASYFAHVAGVKPKYPPNDVLVRRQAIDGNAEGLAFLAGDSSRLVRAPDGAAGARPEPTAGLGPQVRVWRPAPAEPQPAATGDMPGAERRPVAIRVDSPVGLEPLYVIYSAECPPAWYRVARFTWKLDGRFIGDDSSGQRTILEPGRHELTLEVVAPDGRTYTARTSIHVLRRMSTRAGGR